MTWTSSETEVMEWRVSVVAPTIPTVSPGQLGPPGPSTSAAVQLFARGRSFPGLRSAHGVPAASSAASRSSSSRGPPAKETLALT